MNKRKSMSRYAFLLLGIVIMSEPVLSYGYTIKQPVESELSAYGNALEDTDQNATVEVAPRELVSWKVYFVDEESRQIQLSAMRSGTILEGEELVIPYANSLIVNGHRWLANEDSPYRINVYGPGEKIIYITYSDEGSVGDVDDPDDLYELIEAFLLDLQHDGMRRGNATYLAAAKQATRMGRRVLILTAVCLTAVMIALLVSHGPCLILPVFLIPVSYTHLTLPTNSRV